MDRVELIKKLLGQLDSIARDYDHYEYGLPLHQEEVESYMVDKVLLFLKEIDTVSE